MKLTFLVLAASAVITLGPSSFDQLFLEIAPPKAELWRSIPWETELLEAQAIAAESQKPLFIWAMDGHPLGCT